MLKRIVVFLLMACSGSLVVAQTKQEKDTVAQGNLNRLDAKQRKQGMWFYDHPVHFGDPGYYEFGTYIDDRKNGLWYTMSKERLLMSIENYKMGELDGPAQYFENGRLVMVGNYRGIFTPYADDTFWVKDPYTLADTMVVTPAERGHTKHGLWRYYDAETGHLIMEREYQVDIILSEKKFSVPEGMKSAPVQAPKLPHEGGKVKGWSTGKGKSRNSLIK